METFNWNTITNFRKYLDEGYDSEDTEIQRMKAIDVMIKSIRYSKRPGKTYKGISTMIEIIIEKCVRRIDENIIVGDEKVLRQELENDKEIKRFGHRIGEKEIERRFKRFMEWFENEVNVKSPKYLAIRNFKELLYLEETIVNDNERWKVEKFQKNFNYGTEKDYVMPWKNSRLTDEIIKEFIKEKSFAILIRELDSDKFEIISSDESEIGSDDEKSKVKKTSIKEIVELLSRWGIWITEGDVSRIMRMGFMDHMITVKFWEEYQKIQENSDEKD
ncbi:unnamed protein product [Rhizophagus irregularis]|nr:unnamed protein product [Rhizophagus irregularis]